MIIDNHLVNGDYKTLQHKTDSLTVAGNHCLQMYTHWYTTRNQSHTDGPVQSRGHNNNNNDMNAEVAGKVMDKERKS